jgi:hypothetical protein
VPTVQYLLTQGAGKLNSGFIMRGEKETVDICLNVRSLPPSICPDSLAQPRLTGTRSHLQSAAGRGLDACRTGSSPLAWVLLSACKKGNLSGAIVPGLTAYAPYRNLCVFVPSSTSTRSNLPLRLGRAWPATRHI